MSSTQSSKCPLCDGVGTIGSDDVAIPNESPPRRKEVIEAVLLAKVSVDGDPQFLRSDEVSRLVSQYHKYRIPPISVGKMLTNESNFPRLDIMKSGLEDGRPIIWEIRSVDHSDEIGGVR